MVQKSYLSVENLYFFTDIPISMFQMVRIIDSITYLELDHASVIDLFWSEPFWFKFALFCIIEFAIIWLWSVNTE
jgi:hypothetical protein